VGFPEIARRLRAITRAEEHHGERYKKSLKEVEGAKYLRKTGKTAGSAGDAAISMKVKLRLRNVLHAIRS